MPARAPTAEAASRRGGPTDPSHDEELRRGILRTEVEPRVAKVLVASFVAIMAAVPIAQAIRDKVAGDASVLGDLFRHAPTRDNLRQFEDDLAKASTPREWVRPRMQELFLRFGGFGNTKAVVGRDGWLFYGPGVTAVGGPGFLDAAVIDSRKKAAFDAGDGETFPDPRPAVVDFARALAQRGITLVLFPVPDKASLQPRELHGRALSGCGSPPRNPDTDRFESELRNAGVIVFDPTPPCLPAGEPPRFLQQDTHWTPAWMDTVATEMAATIARDAHLGPPTAQRRWHLTNKDVSRVGDIVDMLALPEGQTLFAPATVTISEVRDEADALFEPSESADVLLLGDSFTNVFALDGMGWGEGAGFGAHLAHALGRDVDVIARNDSGAFATRQLLANAIEDGKSGVDRLTGKKVVVWEFASRELAVGDWKPIAWSPPPSTTATAAGKKTP